MVIMTLEIATRPTRSNCSNHHGQVVVRLHRLVGVRGELGESSHHDDDDGDDDDVDSDGDVHRRVDDAHGSHDEYGNDQVIST